ncbi:histidine kinase [Candidatus Magnetomorum sp. HK-1]|nr:histidine kinase [Candidatus Magnetomorum sp. HK-1]
MSVSKKITDKAFILEKKASNTCDHNLINKDQIKILIVDDNLMNRVVATKLLEKLGFRADLVTDGTEAVQALEVFDYDIVFMDIQMPEMDGFEATKLIRAKEKEHKQVPIIALTANTMQEHREKCIQCGMNDHIGKPFKKGDFEMILNKYLNPNGNNTCIQESNTIEYSDDPIWDRSVIAELIGDDKEEQTVFIQIFIEELTQQIDHLKEAIHSENLKTINIKAHRIKGSAGDIGAVRIRNISASIEGYAEKNLLEPCVEQLALFEKESKALLELLKNYIVKE